MRSTTPRLLVALALTSCAPLASNGDALTSDATSPRDGTVTPPTDARTPTDDVRTPPDDAPTPPEDVRTPPMDVRTPPDDVRTPPTDTPVVPMDRISTTTPPPGDPATRTQSEVCALWNDASTRASRAPAFTPGSGMCAPGTLPQATRDAAILMTNAHRWLAGLTNVGENATYSQAAQACAELMQANNMLSHAPPTTWSCYTALGAMGAGKSNITSGGSSPVSSIAGWVDDQRDISMTLGHRRWVLYPPLGDIGYGQSQRYACQYVIGTRASGAKPWVAWPNEGVTPMEASTPLWSFSSARLGVTASTRAAVTANGAPVSVSSGLRTNGYGDPTISWMMPALVAGTTYRVTVTGLSPDTPVTYEVRPVRCGM